MNSMPDIFRKPRRGLALVLAAAMCVSFSSVPAFAAENVETVTSEDGRTTTIPDEEVPVADVPQTGDDSGVWYLLLMASLAGLAVMGCLEFWGRRKTTIN